MAKNSIILNGDMIAQLRGRLCWTQDKLAQKAKLDKKTIENTEAGHPVSRTTHARIAEALDVDPAELLLGWTVDTSSADSAIKSYVQDFDTLIADRVQDFVGRVFAFDAIDAFLKNERFRSGYLAIEGKPGMGKTALMSQLIRIHGYRIHHFNIATQGINTLPHFLGNICARLMIHYQLLVKDIPSDFCKDSTYLGTLLNQVSQALKKDEQLVVIVDALDEAATPGGAGTNPLCLPGILPPQVYFIVTARCLDDLALRVSNLQRLELKHDGMNLDDIRCYLTEQSGKPALRKWISHSRLSHDDFVEAMADHSEGNFMYLRYVLPELVDGAYRDIPFDMIPVGLDNYYEDHWRRMGMTASPLPRTKLKVLYGMARSKKPVSNALLADFLGEDAIAVQEILNEWRQFLNAQEVDNTRRYSFYHGSFRDFLHRKDIVQAAGISLKSIDKQIADNIMDELFGK